MSTLFALASAAQTPVQVGRLGLAWLKGQESSSTVLARLGLSPDGLRRAPGPCIWFHAATVAECAVALPVLFRCLQEYNEKVTVLLTVGSKDAHEMLKGSLPQRVAVQLMPIDNPLCVALFLKRWRPQVGILMETPFFPNLVLVASLFGVRLSLLNAHIPSMELLHWHAWKGLRRLLGAVLDKFVLIVPASDVDVGRLRIFGARMGQMPGWCSDLRHAAALGASAWHAWQPSQEDVMALKQALAGRPLWVAANTQPGEEAVVARVHARLLTTGMHGACVAVVPHDPRRCPAVAEVLRGAGLRVGLWSDGLHACTHADALLVDDPHALPLLYAVFGVTVVGNSLVEGCSGHNLSEAAVAGCAVVVGPHAGASLAMAEQLNQAAVVAAEEAMAAVRSSGPLAEDGAGAIGVMAGGDSMGPAWGHEGAGGMALGVMEHTEEEDAGLESDGGPGCSPHVRPASAPVMMAACGQHSSHRASMRAVPHVDRAAEEVEDQAAEEVEDQAAEMAQEENTEWGPDALQSQPHGHGTTNMLTVVHSRPSSADPLGSGLPPMLAVEHSAWSTGYSAAGDSPSASSTEGQSQAATMGASSASEAEAASRMVGSFRTRGNQTGGAATPFARSRHPTPNSPAAAAAASCGLAAPGNGAAAWGTHGMAAAEGAAGSDGLVGGHSTGPSTPAPCPPLHYGSAPASRFMGMPHGPQSRADMWDELFAATTSSPMPWSPSAITRMALGTTSLSAHAPQRIIPRLGLLSSPRSSLDYSPGRLALPTPPAGSSRSATLSSDESAALLGSLRTTPHASAAHPLGPALPTTTSQVPEADRTAGMGQQGAVAAMPGSVAGDNQQVREHEGVAVGAGVGPLAPVQLAAAFHRAANEATAALESGGHTRPSRAALSYSAVHVLSLGCGSGSGLFDRGSAGGCSTDSASSGSAGTVQLHSSGREGSISSVGSDVMVHARGLPRLSVPHIGPLAFASADSGSAASSAMQAGTAKGSLSNWLAQPNLHPVSSLGMHSSLDFVDAALFFARGSGEVPSPSHSSPGGPCAGPSPATGTSAASPGVGGGRVGSAGMMHRPSRLRKTSNGGLPALVWEDAADGAAVQTSDAAVQTTDHMRSTAEEAVQTVPRTADAAVQVELLVPVVDAHTVVPVTGAQQLGVTAYHLLPRASSRSEDTRAHVTVSTAWASATQQQPAAACPQQQQPFPGVPSDWPQTSCVPHMLQLPPATTFAPSSHTHRMSSPAVLSAFPALPPPPPPLTKSSSGHHRLPVTHASEAEGEELEVVPASFSAMGWGTLTGALMRRPSASTGGAQAAWGSADGQRRSSGAGSSQSQGPVPGPLLSARGGEWGSQMVARQVVADVLGEPTDHVTAHGAYMHPALADALLMEDSAGHREEEDDAAHQQLAASLAPAGTRAGAALEHSPHELHALHACDAASMPSVSSPSLAASASERSFAEAAGALASYNSPAKPSPGSDSARARVGDRVSSVQSLAGMLDAPRSSPEKENREREKEQAARMPCVVEADLDGMECEGSSGAHTPAGTGCGSPHGLSSPHAHGATAGSTWGSVNRSQRLGLTSSGRVSFEFQQVSPAASVASGQAGRFSHSLILEGSSDGFHVGSRSSNEWAGPSRTDSNQWSATAAPVAGNPTRLARTVSAVDRYVQQATEDEQDFTWPWVPASKPRSRMSDSGSTGNVRSTGMNGLPVWGCGPPQRRSDSGIPSGMSTVRGSGLALQSSLFGASKPMSRSAGASTCGAPDTTAAAAAPASNQPAAPPHPLPRPFGAQAASDPLHRTNSTSSAYTTPTAGGLNGITGPSVGASVARPLVAQLHSLAEESDAWDSGLCNWPLPSLANLPESGRSSSPNAADARISVSGWMVRDSSHNSREMPTAWPSVTGSHTSHSSGRTSATCTTPQPGAVSAADAAAAAAASGIAVTIPGAGDSSYGAAGAASGSKNQPNGTSAANRGELGGWLEQQLAMAAKIAGLAALPAPEEVGAAIAAAASLCAKSSKKVEEDQGPPAAAEEVWGEGAAAPVAASAAADSAASQAAAKANQLAAGASFAVTAAAVPGTWPRAQQQQKADEASLLGALKPVCITARPAATLAESTQAAAALPAPSPRARKRLASMSDDGSTPSRSPSPTHRPPGTSASGIAEALGAGAPHPDIELLSSGRSSAHSPFANLPFPFIPGDEESPVLASQNTQPAPVQQHVAGTQQGLMPQGPISAAASGNDEAAAVAAQLLSSGQVCTSGEADVPSNPCGLTWPLPVAQHNRSQSTSSAAGGSSACGSAAGPSAGHCGIVTASREAGTSSARNSADMRTVLLAPAVTPGRDARASPAGRSLTGSGNMRPLRTRTSATAAVGGGSSASGCAGAANSGAPTGSPHTPRSLSMSSSVRGSGAQGVDACGSPRHSLSIEDLEALARSDPGPAASVESEESAPDTPTSRLSVVNAANSPFAHAVYDRPDPFRPSPRTSVSGSAANNIDSLVALAQQPAVAYDPYAPGYTAAVAGGPEPNTPTSRMSVVNTATSPFACAVLDRPCPFRMSAQDISRPQVVAESESSPLAVGFRAGPFNSPFMSPYACGPAVPAPSPLHYGATVVVASAAAASQSQQQLQSPKESRASSSGRMQQPAAAVPTGSNTANGGAALSQHAAMVAAALEKEAASTRDGFLRPSAFDFYAASTVSSMAPSTAASNMTSPQPKQFLSRTGGGVCASRRSGAKSVRQSLESVTGPAAATPAQPQMAQPSTPRTLRRFLSHQDHASSLGSSAASSLAAAAALVTAGGVSSGDEGSTDSMRGRRSVQGNGGSARLQTRLSANSSMGSGTGSNAHHGARPSTAPHNGRASLGEPPSTPRMTRSTTPAESPFAGTAAQQGLGSWNAGASGSPLPAAQGSSTPRASKSGSSATGSAAASKIGTPAEIPPSPHKPQPHPTPSRTAVLNAALLAAAVDSAVPTRASALRHSCPAIPSAPHDMGMAGLGVPGLAPIAAPSPRAVDAETIRVTDPVSDWDLAGEDERLGRTGSDARPATSSPAPNSARLPPPSPRKPPPSISPVRIVRRAAYQALGQNPDPSALLAVSNTVASVASHIAAAVGQGNGPSAGGAAAAQMQPLSPRSPYRQLFSHAAAGPFAPDPSPAAQTAVGSGTPGGGVSWPIITSSAAAATAGTAATAGGVPASPRAAAPVSPRAPPAMPPPASPRAAPAASLSLGPSSSLGSAGSLAAASAFGAQVPAPVLAQLLASVGSVGTVTSGSGSPQGEPSLAQRTERVLSLQQEFSLNPHDAALVESIANALAAARSASSPTQPSSAKQEAQGAANGRGNGSRAVSPTTAAAAAAAAAVVAAQQAAATTALTAALGGSLMGPGPSAIAAASPLAASQLQALSAPQSPSLGGSPVVIPFDGSTPLPPGLAPVVVEGVQGPVLVAAPAALAQIHSTSKPSTPREADDGMAALLSQTGLRLTTLKLPQSARADSSRAAASARVFGNNSVGASTSGAAGPSACPMPGTAPAAAASSAAVCSVWAPVALGQQHSGRQDAQPLAAAAVASSAAAPMPQSGLAGSSQQLSAAPAPSRFPIGRPPRPAHSRSGSAGTAAAAATTAAPAAAVQPPTQPSPAPGSAAVNSDRSGDQRVGSDRLKGNAMLSPRSIRAELEGLRKTLQSFTFPSMPPAHHHGQHHHGHASGGSGSLGGHAHRSSRRHSDCFDLLSGESSEGSTPSSSPKLLDSSAAPYLPTRPATAGPNTTATKTTPQRAPRESGSEPGNCSSASGVQAGTASRQVPPAAGAWSGAKYTASEGRALAAAARAALDALDHGTNGPSTSAAVHRLPPAGPHFSGHHNLTHHGSLDMTSTRPNGADTHSSGHTQGSTSVAMAGGTPPRRMDTADDQAAGALPLSRSRASSFDSTRGAPRIVPSISRDTTPDQRMRARPAGMPPGGRAHAGHPGWDSTFHAHSHSAGEDGQSAVPEGRGTSRSQLSDDWCSVAGSEDPGLLLQLHQHRPSDGSTGGAVSPGLPASPTAVTVTAAAAVWHARPAANAQQAVALPLPPACRPASAPAPCTHPAAAAGPAFPNQARAADPQLYQFVLGTVMNHSVVGDHSTCAAPGSTQHSRATSLPQGSRVGGAAAALVSGVPDGGKDQNRKVRRSGPAAIGSSHSAATTITAPLDAGVLAAGAGPTSAAPNLTASRASTGSLQHQPQHTQHAAGTLPPRNLPGPSTSNSAGAHLGQARRLGAELAAKAVHQPPRGAPSATSLVTPQRTASTGTQLPAAPGAVSTRVVRGGSTETEPLVVGGDGHGSTSPSQGMAHVAAATGTTNPTPSTSHLLPQHPAAPGVHNRAGLSYALPAHHMACGPTGPAVWCLPCPSSSSTSGPSSTSGGSSSTQEVEDALFSTLSHLLFRPLEARSRGVAAAQAAAKLASGLVNTVWHVLDDTVITPALHEYVQAQGAQHT